MEEKTYKKRKRLARPRALVFFGIVFLVLPFINYFAISYQTGIKYTHPLLVLKALHIPALILLFASFAVGIGLLSVKKWGWRLFLAYAVFLISYNAYVFINKPAFFNMSALLYAVFGMAAVLYFTRQDVSAPYMKMYPRGWRMEKRKPVVVEIAVGDRVLKTRDFNIAGFYADWADCPHHPNDEVPVKFQLGEREIELTAGVVRVDANGVGIAFRSLDRETKADISRLLKNRD